MYCNLEGFIPCCGREGFVVFPTGHVARAVLTAGAGGLLMNETDCERQSVKGPGAAAGPRPCQQCVGIKGGSEGGGGWSWQAAERWRKLNLKHKREPHDTWAATQRQKGLQWCGPWPVCGPEAAGPPC